MGHNGHQETFAHFNFRPNGVVSFAYLSEDKNPRLVRTRGCFCLATCRSGRRLHRLSGPSEASILGIRYSHFRPTAVIRYDWSVNDPRLQLTPKECCFSIGIR